MFVIFKFDVGESIALSFQYVLNYLFRQVCALNKTLKFTQNKTLFFDAKVMSFECPLYNITTKLFYVEQD